VSGWAWILIPAVLCLLAGGASAAVHEHTVENGPVRATLRIEPDEPRIGDPVVLWLEVSAEPGVELIMPEFGEALDRFTIVDFAPSEGLDPAGRSVATHRYTLAPSRSGSQSVPPLLIEFVDRRPGRTASPDDADAYELLTERAEFEVAAVLPEDAPLELRPMLGVLPPLAGPGRAFWPWLLAIGAIGLALSPFAYRALLRYQERQRRASAYEVARAELDALLYGPRPDASGMDAFFVELSRIVRRYLEDRFAVRSPELTTDEFLEQLSDSPELVRSHRELLQSLLRRADLVKFAHHDPGPEGLEESIGDAQRFLEATRSSEPETPNALSTSASGVSAPEPNRV
jgi:hypothetical protein